MALTATTAGLLAHAALDWLKHSKNLSGLHGFRARVVLDYWYPPPAGRASAPMLSSIMALFSS
jgi:hypothetical protein